MLVCVRMSYNAGSLRAASSPPLGLPMFVTNSDVFGYMLSPKDVLTLEESRNDFVNFKIKTLGIQYVHQHVKKD